MRRRLLISLVVATSLYLGYLGLRGYQHIQECRAQNQILGEWVDLRRRFHTARDNAREAIRAYEKTGSPAAKADALKYIREIAEAENACADYQYRMGDY